MPPLTVSTDVRDGACVIRVDGDAGVANAERLDVELARACTRRPALAVVDLGGLTFISSMGMGALVNFHRAVESHGGVVRFAAAQPRVADAPPRAPYRRARAARHGRRRTWQTGVTPRPWTREGDLARRRLTSA